MKKKAIHVLACLMACVLFLTSNPSVAYALPVTTNETDDFQEVVSVEGATLGQGFYVEPTAYSLDEINTLLGQEGYGPYVEEDLTGALVTLAMFIDKGFEYESTGDWESDFYLSSIKDIDKGYTDIPGIITENGGPDNDTHMGNSDEYLGEFDYNYMSGWMITVNDFMINLGSAAYKLVENAGVTCQDYEGTYVVRWHYTLAGMGSDLGYDSGWGADVYFEHANKDMLYMAYANSDNTIVKAEVLPVMENLVATQEEVDEAAEKLLTAEDTTTDTDNKTDRTPQDVSAVLNATLAQLATTVSEPSFGTTAGEWSVLSLARGGYYNTGAEYFEDYYDRIVEIVDATATSVNLNGALHKTKSTENSRLILALSAIGKDATKVGKWNLLTPYGDFAWIKKQGINGPIFALIALDSKDYTTEDTTIRQQCVDYILENQLADGGWALSGTVANPDVTAMALQALYPYRSESDVAAAAKDGFSCLSTLQQADGGYIYDGESNCESVAQVIVACSIWGINPDTDVEFVKGDTSAVDALLDFYIDTEARFCHIKTGGSDAMATDQACYALVAYNRLLNEKNGLYDMTDVSGEEEVQGEMSAKISLPEKISNKKGTEFNAVISLKGWNNDAGYKLMDAIVSVPDVLTVTEVTMGNAVSGGELNYYLEEDTGKLRLVYADLSENKDITINGNGNVSDFMTISFEIAEEIDITRLAELNISLLGMSFKLTSESIEEDSMMIVDITDSLAVIQFVQGIGYSAMKLYTGDDMDLISSEQTAVVVAVTGIEENAKLSYTDGKETLSLLYSEEFSEKMGILSYVCIADASMELENFALGEHYEIDVDKQAEEICFGDANGDGIVNAQDALASVNFWLRKSSSPQDRDILALNVNADSRLNTYDALGIVEYFVNGDDFAVVNKVIALKSVIADEEETETE